ncbi:hypothetical protein OIU34_20950 [Pararhizobium sp. BT-229]|uniref:hypothetical protein n=1 Tax=Pararhizobium sp. BT-229 TaxID=2986923 RepID=UPI0021F7255A|nr:hypothetical protein [Pararhizobium sp. BT-229]MCV9964360.1 hypothetical protein [Pararhizobium sp. BT-229]
MVDFKKLTEKMYANATPEERARIDAYNAREAKFDLTRRQIEATFTRFAERPRATPVRNGPKTETYPERTWTKMIDVRIEDASHSAREYEIIRFIGGSTGHEAYELDEEFATLLTKGGWAEPDTMWICAGSVRYDGCAVSTSDIIDYIREMRPQLLGIWKQLAPPPPRAKISF